jgi:hypothetical protein
MELAIDRGTFIETSVLTGVAMTTIGAAGSTQPSHIHGDRVPLRLRRTIPTTLQIPKDNHS